MMVRSGHLTKLPDRRPEAVEIYRDGELHVQAMSVPSQEVWIADEVAEARLTFVGTAMVGGKVTGLPLAGVPGGPELGLRGQWQGQLGVGYVRRPK